MPISDLLAEISGEKPRPSALSTREAGTTGLKRKAVGTDPKSAASKVPKVGGNASSKSAATASHATNGNRNGGAGTASAPNPTITASNANGRPAYTGSARPATASSSSYAGSAASRPTVGKQVAASDPPLNRDVPAPRVVAAASSSANTTPDPTISQPKKGSYQAIMQRAKKAQEKYGNAGIIQHKPIEQSTKSVGQTKWPKKTGSSATTAPMPTVHGTGDMPKYRGSAKDEKGRPNTADQNRRASSGNGMPAPEKKYKKAAAATTGYQGTARPRPVSARSSATARNGRPTSSTRSGGLLAPLRVSQHRGVEEYDEELDDFIDYDEEEEPEYGGRRQYDYASDGSSDMEAGLTDVEIEERHAERAAREEDKKEALLEMRLKRQKEARKRQLLGLP